MSLTADNLLHSVATNFDTLDRQHLNKLLVDTYTLDEFLSSKKILIEECEKINITDAISEYRKKRHNTRSEVDTKQKLSKDILDIWTVVDVQKGGIFQTKFVAANSSRFPLTLPPQSHPSSSTSASHEDVSNNNTQTLVNLINCLKDDFKKQQESILWLVNITRNIYHRLDATDGLDSDASVFEDSFSSTPKTPRYLPKAPKKSGRES